MEYMVYGRWSHGAPIGATTLGRLIASFRPGDESVCGWADRKAPGVLPVSPDVDAVNEQQALQAGRGPLVEAAHLGRSPGSRWVIVVTEPLLRWVMAIPPRSLVGSLWVWSDATGRG